MTVTLATYCHARDLPRLHAPGELETLINCHLYNFDRVFVIHQRCGNLPYELPCDDRVQVLDIATEDYEPILRRFGIDWQDPLLTEVSHGWDAAHFFAHHNVNHCKVILEAKTDYIVFNDADCRMIAQPEGQSWISKAIELMETRNDVFIVAPSDGGHEYIKLLSDGTRLTDTTSQQLFIGKTTWLREMDFTNLKWDGKFDAPYGPFGEFYGLFEGHMWRWMRHKGGLYRAVLPEQYRYWHGEWH